MKTDARMNQVRTERIPEPVTLVPLSLDVLAN